MHLMNLKLCPFCGGEPHPTWINGRSYAKCDDCGAKEPIEIWQKRVRKQKGIKKE